MHCKILTQYAIITIKFLAGLRKIKLRAAHCISANIHICNARAMVTRTH